MGKDPAKHKFPQPLPNPAIRNDPGSPGLATPELEDQPENALHEDKTDPEISRSGRTKPAIPTLAVVEGSPTAAGLALVSAPTPIGAPAPVAARPPAQAQPGAAFPPQSSVPLPDLGRLNPLMRDPSITEIMINDTRNVMVEREGKIFYAGFSFSSNFELDQLILTIISPTGRAMNPEQPFADVMLPDGSRVNIIIPPLTVSGPCITIRKFPAKHMNINDLMKSEMLDRKIAYFLNACVIGKMNILVSGGTGTGKTTLLNILTGFIPKTERIIVIEDTAELSVPHPNSVRLQIQPATAESIGITTRELVANSLRMRPDRIIIGECRRAEAFDMLQAMNTGHEGSMATLHANSPRDALSRLETLGMMAGIELPLIAIRKQIANALDLVVQLKRHRNGRRRIVAISEITGIEGDTITLQDIFIFEHAIAPGAPEGHGIFKCTGFVPTFLARLKESGIEMPANFFG